MIWCHGVVDGGSLGQLVNDEEQAAEFCQRIDWLSRKAIRWQLVPVQATESREAHAEAMRTLEKNFPK